MELKASLKYMRQGVQRTRLVADMVRGMSVNQAVSVLSFSKKKAAGSIKKLIQSAAAAGGKVVDIDNLYVKTIYVDQGPHIKRFRPAARGQSSRRNKKQSHIHVCLKER